MNPIDLILLGWCAGIWTAVGVLWWYERGHVGRLV